MMLSEADLMILMQGMGVRNDNSKHDFHNISLDQLAATRQTDIAPKSEFPVFAEDNIVFHILITKNNSKDLSSSPIISENIESVKKFYPGLVFKLFGIDEIRELIRNDFDREVLESFDLLTPYSYKADLAKYCILFRYGGVCVDLSMQMMAPICIRPGASMGCFRDAFGGGSGLWTVSMGLIYSRLGMEAFETAIRLVVQNCSNKFYGPNPLHPTGPGVFGRALAIVNKEEDISVGEFKCLTNDGNPFNFGYVDFAGRIIAMRRKLIGGDLKQIGVKESNNYNEIWNSRNIYSELGDC